jgi:disulfide bond formation protein DsbB
MDYLSLFDTVLAVGMIFIQVIIAFLIVLLVVFKGRVDHPLFSWISRNALLLGFLFSLGATVGSLIYSNVMNFEPCTLCWIQRIFMFPQVLLFGLALIKKDRKIFDYSIILSIVGAAVAINHNMLELTDFSVIPCSATAVSCSTLYVDKFGYITIPVMSLTVFAFLLIIMVIARRHDTQSHVQTNA